MRIVGIDPGQKGGIALLVDGRPIWAKPMPIFDKKVRAGELLFEIDLAAPDVVKVERQTIMGGQRGAMAIGANYGRLMAAVEMSGLPHTETAPAAWNAKAKLPKGMKGRPKKEASYALCERLWGDTFRTMGIKVSQDGLYEALLIARFA